MSSPHAKHRLDTGTQRVRLDLDEDLKLGLWWPRSTDYAAEIHDLAYSCGLAIGRRVERMTFAWNYETARRLQGMHLNGLVLNAPDRDQPREEMRVHAGTGRILRLTVVPPTRHGAGGHVARTPD
ncbi:hypothetical protein TPB0596_32360 [Tsukamurella pulmonis]|uniref:DUF5994 family protein n=1 Tax=Tsukamurella pulmonis TaxID=47312 RepID=UPI00308A4098|nr:hypothetical protein TPB0596_32360 [Tsukamurella pulmonis]